MDEWMWGLTFQCSERTPIKINQLKNDFVGYITFEFNVQHVIGRLGVDRENGSSLGRFGKPNCGTVTNRIDAHSDHRCFVDEGLTTSREVDGMTGGRSA